MILSTSKINQQSHKILIYLAVFYDLYSQKLSPSHKIYPPLTFCNSLQLAVLHHHSSLCKMCVVGATFMDFNSNYHVKNLKEIFISQVTHGKG